MINSLSAYTQTSSLQSSGVSPDRDTGANARADRVKDGDSDDRAAVARTQQAPASASRDVETQQDNRKQQADAAAAARSANGPANDVSAKRGSLLNVTV